MEIYKFCLYLGFTGIAAMALLGMSHIGQSVGHGHGGAHGHGGVHAHDAGGLHGHDLGGSHGIAHTHGHGDGLHGVGGHHHDSPGHAGGHDHAHHSGGRDSIASVLSLLSPRVLFSLLLGFGATGMLLPRAIFPEPFKFALALCGGWGFERLLMAPVWNFMFRFASNPARTLESAVCEEARAVTNFDANGNGLIAIDLDGQVIQVLGTLTPEVRATGVRVRSGDRLFVEAVDTRRNSCTVSLLHS